MPSDTVLYQAAALCLTYPDDDFRARLPCCAKPPRSYGSSSTTRPSPRRGTWPRTMSRSSTPGTGTACT